MSDPFAKIAEKTKATGKNAKETFVESSKAIAETAKNFVENVYSETLLGADTIFEELKNPSRQWSTATMTFIGLAGFCLVGSWVVALTNGHLFEKGLHLYTLPVMFILLYVFMTQWNHGRPKSRGDALSNNIYAQGAGWFLLFVGCGILTVYLWQCHTIYARDCPAIIAGTVNATTTVADFWWGYSGILCEARSLNQFGATSIIVLIGLCLIPFIIFTLGWNLWYHSSDLSTIGMIRQGVEERVKLLSKGTPESQAESQVEAWIDGCGGHGDTSIAKKCIKNRDLEAFIKHYKHHHGSDKAERLRELLKDVEGKGHFRC